MSEKKWPILDNRTDQLSKQRPGKAIALQVFCAWYPCYHQFYKLWQWQTWSCLPPSSSCEHASITSKSDSKVFEFSDKFQRRAVVRNGGNRRWESQKYPCWRRPWLLFCQCSAWALWNVYSHRVCSVGVADFQPYLKWEQCHQHNHSEGFELNPGQ